MKKSKKAVSFLFTQQSAASAAVIQAVLNLTEAEGAVENAIEARRAAWGDLKYIVLEAAKAGFKIETRASAGTMALEVYKGLAKAGYKPQSISNMLTKLRGITGAKNTGNRKRAKKTATQAGPVSGITINIKAGAKPEQVITRVVDLANYLKSEYPSDEKMLRIAAFLADVVEA